MSYKIEIADSTSHKIEISSSINDQTPIIQILEGHSSDINISHDIALLPADFNENVKTIIDSFLTAGYGVSIVPSGSFLRISTSGLQPSGNYSLVGHSHVSSDITNFNSSVSGLLPVKNVVSGSGIAVSDINGTFTVAVTGQFGLTSEQVDDRVSSLLSSGYGINLNYDDNNNLLTISTIGLQPSGNYSVVGHSHVSSDITDFILVASGASPVQTVAGRLGNVVLTKNDVGLNNVDNTSDINKPVSAATQNALNLKSDVGHVHTSSNITDFSSTVSGLLPVKNILSGSGISVTSVGSDFTVAVTGQFGLTGEQVDDRVSNLLVAGNYVNLNYNDSNDSLMISVTGVQPSGDYAAATHNHISAQITDFNTSVSGLLPVVNISAGSNIVISNVGGNFIVGATGLQPSGNYSVAGHSHLSSDITNFNTSVSGLLTPYATINSPSFSGTPTAPTASSGTNNSQIANTQFVRTEISNLVNAAPSTLDTLNELAAALGNDPNFATTITNNLAGKANLTGATFSGAVGGPSGDFGVLKQSGVVVSVSGHTHSYSDITNFASGVSDNLTTALLAGSFINLYYNSSQDTLTISASGLQPSGNYSVVDHTHTSSNITDFNSSVSGLLPTVANSGTNRLLTSTGSNVGVSAQANLTFNGSLLNVTGSGVFSSGLNIANQTASTIASFDNNKNVVSLSTSTYPSLTELAYVKGVTSSVQTQLDNKAASSHTHTSSQITDFNTSVSGLLPVRNISGSGYVNVSSVSGNYTVGVTGLQPSGSYSLIGHTHTSSDITNFNSSVSGLLPSVSGSGYVSSNFANNIYTISVSGLQPSGNYSLVGHSHIISDVADLQSSLDSKASLNSPTFSGIPTVPTANSGTNSTQIASTAFVRNEISNLVASAPSTLDTLNELATALGNDPNFATTVTNNLAGKANISGATFTGSVAAPSGNFTVLQQNGTNVSVSGHVHNASEVTTGTFDLTRIPFPITYPIRAIHVGGVLSFNNWARTASPTYFWGGSAGDMRTLAILEFPATSVSVSVSDSVTKYINDNPGMSLTYASLEVALIDAANRVVGWGTTATSSANQPSNGTAGTSMTIPLLSFPVLNSAWFLGGNSTYTGLNIADIMPITAYKFCQSRYLDIEKTDWDNIPNKPVFSPISISGSANDLLTGTVPFARLPVGTSNTTVAIGNDSRLSDAREWSASTIDQTEAETGTSTTRRAFTAQRVFQAIAAWWSASSAKTKLDGISAGATVNSTDAQLRDRSTHTGTQTANTISDFTTAVVAAAPVQTVAGRTGTVTLSSSDITNFNSSVSGLLPVKDVVASTGINISSISGIYTISSPEEVIEYLTAAQFPSSGNTSLLYIATDDSRAYRWVGSQYVEIGPTAFVPSSTPPTAHKNTHAINGTDPLTPSDIGAAQLSHSHNTNDIINFNTSVSGLLPITNILSGSNILISQSGTTYTVGVTGSLGLSTEEVDDRVASLLVAGSGINLSYNDNANSLTISASGLQQSLTNPITGTGTSGYLSRFNSSTGLTNSIVFESGNRLGINTITPSGALHIVGSGLVASVTGTVPNSLFHLYSATSGASIFNVEGTNGSLFSVDDNLSGTLMSVNNNAGLPVFEVFSDDRVVAGRFNQNDFVVNSSGNIGIGNSGDNNYKFNVTGNANFNGAINISGVPLSEIIDDEVAGLLSAGSGISLSYNDAGNVLTISTSGLQPSGNYSLVGHSHTSSDISDFSTSVSGLLPVTNIIGGTNISIDPSGSSYTVNVSGSLGLTTEEVDDRVSNLLVAGSGINLDYNDGTDTLTIHNTSISPDEIEEYAATSNFPASGNVNILYRTTDDARLYQWSGSFYAEVGPDSVTTGSHASQHYTNGIDPILNVVSRPATLTANVNNYAHNNADIIYLNADANRIITGLASSVDGAVKLLINKSLYTITLDHQDTNSNPENRFMVPFGSDYVLQPGYSITVVYDSDALRWRVLA